MNSQAYVMGSRRPKLCPSCKAELTSHQEQRENICHRLKCRGPWLQSKNATDSARARRQRDEMAARVRQRLAREASTEFRDGRPYLLLVVPHFEGTLAPQSAERKQNFRGRLREAMAVAEQLTGNVDKAAYLLSEYEYRQEEPSASAIVNACSTCGGVCCRQGKEHAFLTPEFLAWRLLDDPQQLPREIVEDYVRRLPEESWNDSCLYHTLTGCNLPRSIRSSTCNDFLCTGIADHGPSLRENLEIPSVAVAADGTRLLRYGVMGVEATRREYELPPS